MKIIMFQLPFILAVVVLCKTQGHSTEYETEYAETTDTESVAVGVQNETDSNESAVSPSPIPSRRPSRLPPRPVRPQNSASVVVGSGSILRSIGTMQCAGLDQLTGGRLVESFLGPGIDASGNYLCRSTCGGECIPNQNFGVAPSSLHPFGCQCNYNRCDQEGPVIDILGNNRFSIVCVRDSRCTCDEMGVAAGRSRGYLCNWINVNNPRPRIFQGRSRIFIHPTFSPVRWCSCCPRTQIIVAAASDRYSSYDYPTFY